MKRLALILVALGLLALAPAKTNAALLVLTHSGTFITNGFGEAVTLGGTPLPDNTPFTYTATFDSTTDLDLPPGYGIFPATVVFDIMGFGTFTSAPGANVNVRLVDLSGSYAVGLLTLGDAEFAAVFSTANPPFSVDSPSPSVLSDLASPLGNFSGSLEIPLANGAGDLVIPFQGIFPFGPTATITAAAQAVPEPSSLALGGIGLVGLLGLARRRRRRGVA